MEINKSALRALFYIGIIITSDNIYTLVCYELLYLKRGKKVCPAFGSVSNCENAIAARLIGILGGVVSVSLLLLKSTETLKYNWVLNCLEPMVCAVQIPFHISLFLHFRDLNSVSDVGGEITWKDSKALMLLSFFFLMPFFLQTTVCCRI